MAMDLILEVIQGWKRLFQEVLAFREVLSSHVSPSLKPYLRSLREDYLSVLKSGGPGSSNSQISLVVRIARSLLLNFLTVRGFLLEVEMLVNLMMHSILPERMGSGAALINEDSPRQIIGIDDSNKLRYDDGSVQIVGLSSGVAGALAGGLMRLAISAQGGIKSAAGGGGTGATVGSAASSVASSRGSGNAGWGFLALCVNPTNMNADRIGILQNPSAVDDSPAASYSAFGSHSLPNDSQDLVYVPTFPIAVCLETVMSLLLSDRATDIMAMGLGGVDAIKTIYSSVISTVTILLNKAFAVDCNVRDFELAVKTSHLAGVLENVFCGSSDCGISENRDAVTRFVHDHVHSSNGISTPEVLVLAFHVLQVATRALTRGSLQCIMVSKKSPIKNSEGKKDLNSGSSELIVKPTDGTESCSLTISIDTEPKQWENFNASSSPFVPQSVLSELPFPTDQLLIQVLQTSGRVVIEDTCLAVHNICMTILWKVEDTVVIRRCLGLITEYALATGFLGLHILCESMIAALCKCSLPISDTGFESGDQIPNLTRDRATSGNGGGSSTSIDRISDSALLRWRNVQAFVRLSQIVHALANSITNWEVIVDCFVQLMYVISNQRSISDDVTPHELDKVFHAIERFQEYSVFLSEEALIRLTTALVCLSMHTVEASTVSLDSGRPPSTTGFTSTGGSGERQSGRLAAPLLSSVSGAAKDVVHRFVGASDAIGVSAKQQQSGIGAPEGSRIVSSSGSSCHHWGKAPPYLIDSLSSGGISYALYAIIDVVKFNSFRLSCVWHMVSSHLRAVALSKVNCDF